MLFRSPVPASRVAEDRSAPMLEAAPEGEAVPEAIEPETAREPEPQGDRISLTREAARRRRKPAMREAS